jgi:hypothetical protein
VCTSQLHCGDEKDGQLAFLDIDIYIRTDGSLGHKMYHMSRHTILCLTSGYCQHPFNSQAVFFILMQRTRAVCNQGSLLDERELLEATFELNDYINWESNKVLPDKDPLCITFLSCTRSTLNCINRVLASCRGSFPAFLQPLKGGPGLKALGDWSDKLLETRVRKHLQHKLGTSHPVPGYLCSLHQIHKYGPHYEGSNWALS